MSTHINKKAYTLAELLTTIMILGVLAAVALPKYTLITEQMIVQEQVPLLMAVFEAQKSKLIETGVYGQFSMASADLDLDVSSSKYFTSYNLGCGSDEDNCPGIFTFGSPAACDGSGWLARVQRDVGGPADYFLYVSETGEIYCEYGTYGDPQICVKLGFSC